MVTDSTHVRGSGEIADVGKTASIDRGWLRPSVPKATTGTDDVGKTASIDRGWLPAVHRLALQHWG